MKLNKYTAFNAFFFTALALYGLYPVSDSKHKMILDMDENEFSQYMERRGVSSVKRILEDVQKKELKSQLLQVEGQRLLLLGRYEHARLLFSKASAINPYDSEIKYFSELSRFPAVDISTPKKIYSISEDGKVSVSVIYSNASSSGNWARKWKFFVKNSSFEEVWSISGTNEPPANIDWDFSSKSGARVNDGAYLLSLTAESVYNCASDIKDYKIYLSREIPKLQIALPQKIFIPGENDVQIMIFSADRALITSWKIEIFDNQAVLKRVISGEGAPPEKIFWDGRDSNGDMVFEGDIFTIIMKADAGGELVSNEDKIVSAIKLTGDRDKLAFKLYTISFGSGSSDLAGSSYPILEMVLEILRKYSWYDVDIRGFTDDIGPEEENERLSAARASAVLEYIAKSGGISKERLKAAGYGEKNPIAPNTTEKGRAKNRRVEFVLADTYKEL